MRSETLAKIEISCSAEAYEPLSELENELRSMLMVRQVASAKENSNDGTQVASGLWDRAYNMLAIDEALQAWLADSGECEFALIKLSQHGMTRFFRLMPSYFDDLWEQDFSAPEICTCPVDTDLRTQDWEKHVEGVDEAFYQRYQALYFFANHQDSKDFAHSGNNYIVQHEVLQ